jgi:DNA-binding transcriptional LysR family regulator
MELEQRLGRPVVIRHTTGYRLTDFGQELLTYAARVEAAVVELELHVSDSARDRSGLIRVTLPGTDRATDDDADRAVPCPISEAAGRVRDE